MEQSALVSFINEYELSQRVHARYMGRTVAQCQFLCLLMLFVRHYLPLR